MYALTHSRPGVERAGHWIRFCLPAALLAGHHLLGKVSLPTALPLSLVEKASALSLCAIAIAAEVFFDYSTPDNQEQPHVLNIDSIAVGAAAVISLYSLISLGRDATLLEGGGGFAVGGAIAVWGAYNMSQSEITDGFIKADRVALVFSAVMATLCILFQRPSIYNEMIRESIDVPIRYVRVHGPWAVWYNLNYFSCVIPLLHATQLSGRILGPIIETTDPFNSTEFQSNALPGSQSLWLGISFVALPLGLNKLKNASDTLTIGVLEWGILYSSLSILAALATWVDCLLYTPPNED